MATEHALRSNWKNGFLSNIVGHLSRETPEALYREYPISSLSYEEGYRRITYHDFANAINGAARWLSETLGLSKNHEVLTYIGPNDLRYTVLVLAAVKAGYVLFLTSPRSRFRVQEAGSLMPEQGSVFIHYEIREKDGYFVIQGREEDVEKFVKCLNHAINAVSKLI